MERESRSIDPVQLDLAIGGQAVMEGVMMRCPRSIATAVRTPGGKIIVRRKPYTSFLAKLKINKIPLLRGGLHLVESMALGIGALMFVFIVFHTLRKGEKIGENPWGVGATTLEWKVASPPPFHTFDELPTVEADAKH